MRTPSPARTLLGALGIAAVLTASACGSTDESGTAEPSPGGTATTSAAPTTTGTPSTSTSTSPSSSSETTAPHPDRCLIGELQVTLGESSGAAGSQEIPIVFTNTGSRTCVLHGYPGVSYLAAPDGPQVGAAAARDGGAENPVTVAPGARATAAVRATVVQNYPAETCGPTAVAGFRVYPPNDTGSVFLPYPTTGCAQTGVKQLSVQPVTG
ncbi:MULTISPECIES: DUF4232 domain-containing protein [unclassified Rhodococcus (in: high G+C Gram-positive bacteria)]|uniref:DUF4232 domain-containing protein n=1 Tax=unclassified Rhodococcus (in: high G+C Gram-positive bacteria) TaxID=192944 RepID=UPI00163AC39E|nr:MULTISPECIES: DUF4232 domain-containing protein [unclassified Rhodococcus (in: high G+C Gram-positive bacteria)]MBC2639144.1 DUF4232 domain-containing protein [Rhodococcus sp. 3A]MBC2896114.1 DUF4232 domain-containing protein [Rhodococcus sp. 4CII]